MRCPQCKAVVPDGATFCDRCDAILDQSFLGGAPERDARTPIPRQRQPQAASRQSPAASRPSPIAGRQPPVASRPPVRPPADEALDTPVPQRAPAVAAAPVQAPKESLAPQAEDALADVAAFVRTLSIGQKVSLGGAFCALIFAFFPWAILPGEGSVSGLDLGSIVVVILAAAFGTLLVLDHRGTPFVRNLRYYYTLVQIGVAAIIVLFCIYRFIHPADITDDVRMLKSSGADVKTDIQIGLPLTMIAAAAAAAGLFMPKR